MPQSLSPGGPKKKKYLELKSSEWLVVSAWQACGIVVTGLNLFGMEGDGILRVMGREADNSAEGGDCWERKKSVLCLSPDFGPLSASCIPQL